ncbi:hypothetical protein K491DRAFT_686189 [Lophiostoma macrostomum CBS 122681]|uniref:Uncharacterized protein n=1 Tax=Lophiostoma macrostomum CBS 122681 TaxID=1314788 RepID=A0A6A6TSH3_9PLEO|nr:hypothetical protein K491DRAFT_686189 [Lophiostoma macrostomum CBS 122681]
MAGTRRRSRISDTASRAASALNDRGHVEDLATRPAVDVPSSIDSSSRASSPESKSTIGVCKRCNGVVGHFFNSWHKITGTYYLPAMPGSYSSKLEPHGKQKAATIGTDLDGCLIQPLACKCTDVLGFHAVDAPHEKAYFR